MTLKTGIAIYAAIAASLFVVGGLCLLAADLAGGNDQLVWWLRPLGFAGAGVGLCTWIYLECIAPGQRDDWRPRRPWSIARWASVVAAAIAVVCWCLAELGALKLGPSLVFDAYLLVAACAIRIRWLDWNEILDDWAAFRERQRTGRTISHIGDR